MTKGLDLGLQPDFWSLARIIFLSINIKTDTNTAIREFYLGLGPLRLGVGGIQHDPVTNLEGALQLLFYKIIMKKGTI